MVAEQLLLDLAHDGSFAAADFIRAPTNRDALAWIERYPAWPASALVLFGPSGAGKSHLARIFAHRTGAVALDPLDLPAPDRRPRGRPLVLDPATAIQDETALLHLYTWIAEQRSHLLLVGREPVRGWPFELDDLRSRLQALPAVELGLPDDDLLAAILVKLFDDRQVRVESGVIDTLVRRMERSYASALALVDALDRLSMREQRPITPVMARRVLATITTTPTTTDRREQDGSRDQRQESDRLRGE